MDPTAPPTVSLSPLANLVSSALPIAIILIICGLAYLIIKGKINKLVGIFVCAILAAATVATFANYKVTGPIFLRLIGVEV